MPHRDLRYALLCEAAYNGQRVDYGLVRKFFVETDDGELVIGYVGSENWVDWLHNVQIRLVSDPDSGHQMHNGFRALWAENWLTLLLAISRHRDYTHVTVTGHSLGGALAILAARLLRQRFPSLPVRLVTFGAPRVFDQPGCDAYPVMDYQAHHVFRRDPFPHLPSRGYGDLFGRVWHRQPWLMFHSPAARIASTRDHFIPRYVEALS